MGETGLLCILGRDVVGHGTGFARSYRQCGHACITVPDKVKRGLNRSDGGQQSPCSKGDMVPASQLRYGSILIDVTLYPHPFSRTPMDDAVTPFPSPDTTPPAGGSTAN